MTKQVRIENADTSDFKVVVEVWEKGYPEGEPDKLVHHHYLDYPTFQVEDYLTSTRWMVVREREPSADK